MIEYEHYGDSLNTHPDYFLMKKAYEEEQENLLIEELERTEDFANFVIPVSENRFNLTGKQQINENEENILRCAVGPVREPRVD